MKKILSIDGGGIRGIIPAIVLGEIENRTGKKVPDLFDLVAGTSTGGIIALAISRDDGNGQPRYSAADLVKLYEERGREIFSRSFWKGVSSVGGVTDEKYNQESLESIFREYFEDEPLGSALTKVMITSYDIQNREPLFFKSWRKEFRSVEMRSVARATSAAPTYFEPALVAIGGGTRALVDGGVCVNNPAMSAYAEACRLFPDEDAFILLSVGTGSLIRPIPYNDAKNWGKFEWAIPILSVVFDGVNDVVDYQLDYLLGDRFFRFQIALSTANDDMDDASKANIEALKSEARRILRTQKEDLETLCARLVEDSSFAVLRD
jgi:predicted acylesterase/phospholipase RssA